MERNAKYKEVNSVKVRNTIKEFAIITVGTAIVDKHEYKLLMDYVRKVDPKAFVTVYSVSDMRYQPKNGK